MLWFPEFFGYFLPGWMFNVGNHHPFRRGAVGHRFHLHRYTSTIPRPAEKSDGLVIFNGQMAKEEFIEERATSGSATRKQGSPRSSPARRSAAHSTISA